MKKWKIRFFLLIVLMLSINGCSMQSLPLHEIVKSQLEVRKVLNCNITNVGNLSELGYEIQEVDVLDDEVKEAVQTEVESYNKLVEITDRDIVRKGDFVEITYAVYCGNELANELTTEIVKVGAGYFNKDLENALIGAKKDKMFTTIITVPKDDENKKYAGKKECFEITVNKIQYMDIVDLTDKFVQKNYNLKTVEEFYKYEEKCIREEKEKEALQKAKNKIIEKARDACNFDLDDNCVMDYALIVYDEYKEMADGYGSDMSEFIKDFTGKTMEEFYESCYEEAEDEIKWMLIVGAVSKEQNMKITNHELVKNAKNDGIDVDSFNNEQLIEYKYQLLEQKVLNYLIKIQKEK